MSLLESAGFGLYQYCQLVLGAGVYLADGAEIQILTSITDSLTEEFKLSHLSKGLMVALVYVGTLLANVISGRLSDRFGRRPVLLFSYGGILVSSIISIFSRGILTLGASRFLCGFFFGTGGPAWNALAAEISPKKNRLQISALALSLFAVGEIYSVTFLWFFSDWRLLVGLSAIPAGLLFVLGRCWLLESPVWLSKVGQVDRARDVYLKMFQMNGKSVEGVALERVLSKNGGKRDQINRFSKYLTIIILCIITFSLNFSFYGFLYGLPQVFAKEPRDLVISAALEIPGYLVGVLLGSRMSRKALMELFFASGLVFTAMALQPWTIKAGIYAWKMASSVGWLVVYLYTSEVFPTEFRSLASGVVMAVGRVGAIVAPMFFEMTLKWSGSFQITFWTITGLMAVCAILVWALPVETKEKELDNFDN